MKTATERYCEIVEDYKRECAMAEDLSGPPIAAQRCYNRLRSLEVDLLVESKEVKNAR